MLCQYLGKQWQAGFIDFAPQLVGYPVAFVREVVIGALTAALNDGQMQVTVDQLQRSFDSLKAQINARDEMVNTREMPAEVVGANGHLEEAI